MIQTTAATVLLRRPNGDFLMQLRDDGRGKSIPYPNMWNFPGGAVEPNEDPLNAVIREIEEEFEIKVQLRDCKELWRYTHDHAAIDHVFLCKVPANTTPILHEGAAWAWMTLDEIEKLKLGFDQGKIVAYIARTRPTEEG